MNRIILCFALCISPFFLNAQILLFKGKVVDQVTQAPLEGVAVITSLDQTTTDADGSFELELAMDLREVVFTFSLDGYLTAGQTVPINDFKVKELGVIGLSQVETPDDVVALEDQVPIITITDSELSNDLGNADVSGLLTASRDVFIRTAAFTFGQARFRIRGLDSENNTVFMNGVPINEMENGRIFWGTWGGLNDVMRNRETSVGLAPVEYTFGGIQGATSIDTRASNQRKQIRLTYSRSNRSYANRAMLTWSSGLLPSGWAVSLSGSRRWGDEGYIEGTSYDAWSYFASIDRKLGDSQTLNLTAFGAPTRRGRTTGAIAELYGVTQNNYYNSNWGWDNGEKRNARIGHNHQPVFILRHDWDLGESTHLTTAASYQFGRNGSTALDWYNARDPRPNYYRYLTSYVTEENPTVAEWVADNYRNNPYVSQLDWDAMYEANALSNDEVLNADGIEGNTVSGKLARYIIEDRRYDSKEANFNMNLLTSLNDVWSIQAGLGYQFYQGDYYKLVDDLLGADFYVDVDRFIEFDFQVGSDATQNDLARPNRILKEGDRWGYDYNPNIRKGYLWLQNQFSFNRVDLFVAGEISQSSFWRVGDVQKGLFPDNSLGESEHASFFNYGVKGGATWKIDNRNYLYANGAHMTRAPFFRNSFVSPRTRNDLVPNLESETIQSGEFGYRLNSPDFKARATLYWAQFRDRTEVISFFNEEDITVTGETETSILGFSNFILQGIDQRNMGMELAVDAKVNSFLRISGVAAVGQYIYNSRANATVVRDADPSVVIEDRVIYQENFRVPGMPQNAFSLGFNFEGKKFWYANFNINYYNNIFIDFNPNRRIEGAVYDLNPEAEQYNNIVEQEQVDGGVTVDFFGGKSFKFGKYFLYLNLGVNNILDNQELITGGFEQLRFDFESQDPNRFPSRYFYLYGRTYFLNLSLRF